jgi:hypothetical protein
MAALQRYVEAVSVDAKWRQLRRTVATMEKGLGRAFATQGRLYRQGSKVLESSRAVQAGSLREAWRVDDWLLLFDRISRETQVLFAEPIQSGAATAMEMAAAGLIAELGADIAFSLTNPRAVLYLQEHGYGLISQIDAVTRGNIATIVDNGVREGWSYNRIADEISSLYSEMAIGKPQLHIDSRAHLIAVTESGNAYEAGNVIVAQDLQDAGLMMEKKWLTVGDERVSDGCTSNEAEGWIPFVQPFSSGHMRPLRFPGCRCTALYRRRQG